MTDATYATMDEAACAAFLREEVVPEMHADPECDRRPDAEPPTYRWLNGHYPGFVKHLQREFDASPADFYREHVLDGGEDDDYDWGLPDGEAAERTRNRLEAHLDELRYRGHPETTIRPYRARLKKYVQLYCDLHGPDLLDGLRDESRRAEEIDRAFTVCKVLDRTLQTPAARRKYVEDVRRFYRELVDAGYISYNPMRRMETRLGLDVPEWDNPSLSERDVETLWAEADTRRERLLVVGLCGWGLRPSELAALHVRQVVLEPEDDDYPFLDFRDGDRKNGPGTVAMLAGADVLDARLDAMADRDGWTGYVFPSEHAEAGHVHVDTLRRWFADLVARTDVTVRGEAPTPKYGRRFWYSLYGEAVVEVAERFTPVAEAQGSADANVVLENYLSEADRRMHLREVMADSLEGLFT
ncbi:tyrosine-type recombinase/integrase [Halarchaeum sp. P4]|uniref:tyrosine-type recombinase/integrase n=1 Tax=Halarchaeum sp. P4 TaxID=3421639 RepID=UPI003EBA9940